MNTVLKVENISKQYRLGQVGTGTLSHDLKRTWYKLRGKEDPYLKIGVENDRTEKGSSDYVWALRDINFEIHKGEMIGVIGKNGAGKSTLLKLLSRVTAPTKGSIKVKGRIAALLEVGTGFHPELTGRENIYLNGAILGMSRKEIGSKLDEIVSFSGCQKYIDTPVKRYSSGMIVRLGFAVAAHLDPDILIVDEVLAVGDAEFQDKCIGKMKDISGEGKTVLFVSHNMATMKALCKRGFLMENGRIVYRGEMSEVIEEYLQKETKSLGDGSIPDSSSSINTGIVKFKKVLLLDQNENRTDKIKYRTSITIKMELESQRDIQDCLLDVRINSAEGIEIAHSMNKYSSSDPCSLKKGMNSIDCEIQNSLQPGRYSITIGVHQTNGLTLDFVERIVNFTVLTVTTSKKEGFKYDFKLGYVRFESSWRINEE